MRMDVVARANVDSSVNYMLEAQRELLFALSTGYLSPADMTEAMGKYAVAVAFSSRWRKTGAAVLERALRYHSKSIDAGNNSPQAYEYLVELQAELFNATSDQAHLDRAIAVAKERGLELPLAELLLKRGVLRHSLGLPGSIPDLQQSSFLASRSKSVGAQSRPVGDPVTLPADRSADSPSVWLPDRSSKGSP